MGGMSDDRPPSDAGAGAGHGDTPREGTPAFDEIDPARPPAPPTTAVIDAHTDAAHRKDTLQMNRRANVTLPDGVIGPAPDHASAYVPPHAAPKPAVHKTLEVELVRVDTRPDPRRAAQTQKLPRIPERSTDDIDTVPEGMRVLPEDDATDPDLAAPLSSSRRSSMGGLISIALLAFAAVFVVGILLFKIVAKPATPEPQPPTAITETTAPIVRTGTPDLPAPTEPSQPPEPVTSADPSNSASPSTSAAPKPTPQTTKSGQTEVKSPSTSEPGKPEPINN